MAKCWNVRLKKTINPSIGLVEGITIQVISQGEGRYYPDLRKALMNAGYDVSHSGGWEDDSHWDWM